MAWCWSLGYNYLVLDIKIIVCYQGIGRRLPGSPQDKIRSQHALCVFLVCYKLCELYTW